MSSGKHNKFSIADVFFKRLAQFGDDNGWSLRHLSEVLGKSSNYLSTYKAKGKLPSLYVLLPLQEKGLDIYWLFTGEPFSLDIKPIKDNIDSERARIVQAQWVKERERGGPSHDHTNTMGRDMDEQTIPEIWDQLSVMFPTAPMWEMLKREDQSDVLYAVAQAVLTEMKRLNTTQSTKGEEAP